MIVLLLSIALALKCHYVKPKQFNHSIFHNFVHVEHIFAYQKSRACVIQGCVGGVGWVRGGQTTGVQKFIVVADLFGVKNVL